MKQTKQYNCGLRVAHQYIPSVRSVAIGVYVGAGCVLETKQNNGISHFIEHMVFKGTANRTAFQIANEIDEIGANINAFTSKTETCFYTISLDDDAEHCMDILSDLYFNPTFDEAELEKEKGVVLEEIDMTEDTPDDLALELATGIFFKGNPLEKTILGEKKHVKAFTRDDLVEYKNQHYTADNTVISVVGNITFDKVEALIEKMFLSKFLGQKRETPNIEKSAGNFGQIVKFKDIEQSNVCILFPSLKFNDKDKFALNIFNNVFGGGMSSRLFQNIREQKGLAYSVYSYPSAYAKEGYFSIYIGANKTNVDKAVAAVREEIELAVTKGLTEAEFKKGKAQEKASLVFGQESTSTLMRIYGKYMLVGNVMFDLDDCLKRIDNTTIEQVNAVVRNIFDFKRCVVSYVGPKADIDLYNILTR